MISNVVHRPPTNYFVKAGCVMSIGIAIMLAVVMCPFCILHRTMLFTQHETGPQQAVAVVVSGLHVQTSLLTIDVAPICGTDIGALSNTVEKAVRILCYGTGSTLWGKHLVFDMNSHACNLEEQLRASGFAFARAVSGDVGCIQFNVAKVASLAALALTLAAITFHILAVVHTQMYYSVDQSPRRRCIANAFWGLSPGCAMTAAILYYALVNPTRLILQGLFRPSPGEFYPIAWGTVWWVLCLAMSLCNCVGMIASMDHLLPAETLSKYAEYEALSASRDAYYTAVEHAEQYGALEKGVAAGYGAPAGYGPPSGLASTSDTYVPRPR
jgi:hypothetical protein